MEFTHTPKGTIVVEGNTYGDIRLAAARMLGTNTDQALLNEHQWLSLDRIQSKLAGGYGPKGEPLRLTDAGNRIVSPLQWSLDIVVPGEGNRLYPCRCYGVLVE